MRLLPAEPRVRQRAAERRALIFSNTTLALEYYRFMLSFLI